MTAPTPVARRARPAARILLTDAAGRVLLFRFVTGDRPPFWCTPGGGVDPGGESLKLTILLCLGWPG